jgi:cytochrome c oxidase subunit II
MALRTPSLRRIARWVPAACVVLALVLLAGCAPDGYPQTTLAPKSDFAALLDTVFRRSFQLATIVFFLVEGALVWALFRFRGKPGDAEPAQTHGNAMLEVVWTVIPAVILVFIAIPTIQVIFKTASVPTDNPLVIEVTGHQWWWEFRYPEYNLVTAGDMHVPAGRTVDLRMTTADVVHSFWTPQLAGKRDVFPKRDNRLWFRTETPGTYPGQCAEFCGTQHARMAFNVVAQDSAAFEAWRAGLAAVSAPVAAPADSAAPAPAADPLVAQGQQLFTTKACVGCHAVTAVGAPTMTGPNLAGVGDRTHIAAGWLPNTDENLRRWLHNPQAVKVGVLMPNLGLTDDEITALVAYLRSLRAVPAPAAVALTAPGN